MSISSGRAMRPRRRCAAWPIATCQLRRSMSAATRFWRCAISPRNSANASGARLLSSARRNQRRGSPTHRRRQICSACRNAATKLGLTTWRDATPDGAKVYGPLGFTPTLQLRRLRLEAPAGTRALRPLSACSPAEFVVRDQCAMGFDRSALLKEFAERGGSRMVSSGSAAALVRDGRTARQIGPLFADNHGDALALVDAIVRSEQGPWLLDAVHSQAEFLEGVTSAGWIIERPFQRMRFGLTTMLAAELPLAVAGPEFG